MKKIVIFGATSAIAQAAAKIWASQGHILILCARHAGRLDEISKDLSARGASVVHKIVFDASDATSCIQSTHAALRQGCDIALLAHGVLTDKPSASDQPLQVAESLQINFVSYACISEILTAHFETQQSGTLALISSVAGDRGRASNYIYGAAKAGVTALASGLRGRLNKVGVNVVTIKPGFVSTPMTAQMKQGLLFASANNVGATIVKSIEQGRSVVYAPGFWRVIMGILAHVPECIFHKLPI